MRTPLRRAIASLVPSSNITIIIIIIIITIIITYIIIMIILWLKLYYFFTIEVELVLQYNSQEKSWIEEPTPP